MMSRTIPNKYYHQVCSGYQAIWHPSGRGYTNAIQLNVIDKYVSEIKQQQSLQQWTPKLYIRQRLYTPIL